MNDPEELTEALAACRVDLASVTAASGRAGASSEGDGARGGATDPNPAGETSEAAPSTLAKRGRRGGRTGNQRRAAERSAAEER